MQTTARTATTLPSAKKGLHITLWVFQVLLGAAFLMAGALKASQPIDELAKQMTWVTHAPAALVRFVGVVEVAGALGLILPSLTRIKPALTPLAALGLVIVMVLAFGTHIVIGEGIAPPTLILGALTAFVAWGRFKAAPIAPRA